MTLSCGAALCVSMRICLAFLLYTASAAGADELPEQIRIIVPLAAGASLDARARIIADALGGRLGRRVMVENRPGAGGTLGAQYVAKAKPDGSVLLFNNNSHVVNTHIYRQPGYDPIRDFVPVTQAYASGMVLVAHASLGVHSVRELVSFAQSRSTPLIYASSGTGGLPHLAMEMFKRTAGIDLLHVPYRGDGQALSDLLTGRVSLMMSGYPVVQPHIRSGTLRALAVSSAERAEIFPGVPTVAEAGYRAYRLDAWVGFFAPADTPTAVVEHLSREIAAAVTTPSVRTRLAETGALATVVSPAEFAEFVKQEWERYGALVRELGLEVE
jgi:tripartite-type tricarboxylate transporter receptor subunit TctC